MPRKIDPEITELHNDVARRQYYQKSPQPIAETLSQLLVRRGYAQLEVASQQEKVWRDIVGEKMAGYSRLGNLRRGVLEVTVCNSAVVQELTFQKSRLLRKIAQALPNQKIRDLRFRVSAVK